MGTFFKTETDVAQNLIHDFFSNFGLSKDLSLGRILSEKKHEGMGLLSEKTEALYKEINERVEAATSSYSATGNFYNIFILFLWLRIIRRPNQGV